VEVRLEAIGAHLVLGSARINQSPRPWSQRLNKSESRVDLVLHQENEALKEEIQKLAAQKQPKTAEKKGEKTKKQVKESKDNSKVVQVLLGLLGAGAGLQLALLHRLSVAALLLHGVGERVSELLAVLAGLGLADLLLHLPGGIVALLGGSLPHCTAPLPS